MINTPSEPGASCRPSRALEVDINDLGTLDLAAESDLVLSSMCTVFAESEVISLIANNTEQKEISRGLNRTIASRTHSILKRVAKNIDTLPVSMSGQRSQEPGSCQCHFRDPWY
ncbi:MAG: hypothetical protein HN417_11450 [Desulfobacula sp.]|jgi:(R)-2-hydroxyacyl-CoA dehydratese activating ATPase|nr:hypothetical protein [Desulfobacula sp.]